MYGCTHQRDGLDKQALVLVASSLPVLAKHSCPGPEQSAGQGLHDTYIP